MKALTTEGLTKLIQLSKDEFLSKNNTTTVTTSGLKTINNTSLLGTGDISITGLPSQSGQSGKYLTTNGTSASWTAFDDSNLVHKTGTESIGGNKTFLNAITILTAIPMITLDDNNYTKGTTATTDEYEGLLRYRDKDGKDLITDYNYIPKNTNNTQYIKRLYKNTANSDTSYVDVITATHLGSSSILKIGTTTATSPTPTEDTTSSQQIDTVGARNTKLASYQPLLVSGTNIKTINNNSILGSGNLNVDGLPSQSGQNGKFLTTNGSAASWSSLPVDQTYSGTSTNAQSGAAVKQAIDAAISSVYKPAGSVAFANRPALSASIEGNVYNITDAFTTTSDFVEGAGKNYPAGTNIVCINTATSGTAVYKWDVLSSIIDLSGYQTKITGAATTITDSNLTASRALVSNSSGKVAVSTVTSSELSNLSGTTSAIQTQLNNKQATITGAASSITSSNLGVNKVVVSDGSGKIAASSINSTSLGYLENVTSDIQEQLNNKISAVDELPIIPNFDQMTAVQTIEFDTSDTSWHTIFTRTNTETSHSELTDIIYFRMTVTGTNINHICDCAIRFEGRLDTPTLVAFLKPGTTDVNYCGIRYTRFIYPKALNNGYDWAFEVIQNRNSNARHYKVEVFKTNSKVTWTQGTASIYNSTYHNTNQSGIETSCGYLINSFNGNISQSSWASALNSYLNKYVTFSTAPLAGEAILANQMVFMSDNKFYPATNKTTPIEPGCGIQFSNTAYAVNNAIGWDRIRQKSRITSLTNIPHATLARGNPCYFRCTMDSSGNILSDNYVATSMENGYTWYYLGVAEDANCFSLDTTQSFFISLDSSGNVCAINGKKTAADIVVTASKALVSDSSGKVTASTVTSTELGYVSGVTSSIQTQLNGKQATISGGASTITTSNLTASRALVSNSSGKVAVSDITATELGYLDNVTSNIQTQLNGKQATLTSANAGNGITISNSVISETYPLAWEQVSESSEIPEFNVHVYWGNIDGTLSDQTDLNNALSAKANDNAVVHTSGQETIAGNKSFTGSCTASAPSASASTSTTYIATTGWVNDPTKSTNVVHRSGDETIAGTKTFTSVIQGTAYNAYYGDLAECYETDKCYPKGTLVAFGGTKELTIATSEVNAVISSDPGYVLNKKDDENYQPIALIGRVPVRVIGKVEKFDYIVLNEIAPGTARATKDKNATNIIGRALESSILPGEKLIECSIKLAI